MKIIKVGHPAPPTTSYASGVEYAKAVKDALLRKEVVVIEMKLKHCGPKAKGRFKSKSSGDKLTRNNWSIWKKISENFKKRGGKK